MNDLALIKTAVEKAVAVMIVDEAKEAGQRLEAKIRAKAGEIACLICDKINVEPYGDRQIKITLVFETKSTQP